MADEILQPEQIAQPEDAQEQPSLESQQVNVINPEGELVSIPSHQYDDAISTGFQPATQEHLDNYVKEQKYGSTGQQLLTGLEGAASAATFGASTGLERSLGVKPEDIRGRRETNPASHMTGEAAGLIGSALIPGVGEANLLAKAGEGAAAAIGLAKGTSFLSKVGSGAVKAAVENAIFQGGDEVSKLLSSDPNQSVETAVADMGLSALLGGGLGAGFGAVSPLWDAALGSKTGGILKAVANKAGGIEGVVPESIENAIQQSGINLAPEIRAGLSSDPEIQNMFKTLQQSDTTGSGIKLQQANNAFRSDAAKSIVSSLGRDADSIAETELSKYEAGKNIGNTLAKEYSEQVDPLAKEFDALKNRYADLELNKDNAGSDYFPPTQGTISEVSDKISQLAQKEGWAASPSSDIMSEVNRALRELPAQKTLKDLGSYIKAVGDNMQSDPLNGPMRRAGGLIKSILKDAEGDVISTKLGASEGEQALSRYKNVRDAYAAQAKLQDALDSRLHAGGSTAGYAKALREMSSTDGEAVLRRLSGVNDADVLNLLSSRFPETASALKQYHLDALLNNAISKAKPGEALNTTALINGIKKMSPELRSFVIPEQSLARINAIGTLLDHFNSLPHNFSNSARTLDKLMKYIPGSAVGMVTMLAGHNPAMAILMGSLTKVLGKTAPDAIRLALLKFLGSSQPIESAAFKSMVDFIQHTANGENLIVKGTKNLFRAVDDVIPQSVMPKEKDRTKLDKYIKTMQDQPEALLNVGGKTGHYLPSEAASMGTLSANAVKFLTALRPNISKQSPLDSNIEVTPMQKAAYDKALNIAQQPLSVLQSIKDGTLTPQDLVALKSIYPNLYTKLSQKITDNMIDAVHKGIEIPYKTKMGISLFLGQAMDSTMKPESIISAQISSQSQKNQPAQQQNKAPSASKMTQLNKLPKSYQTPAQASEARRISK